MTAKDPSRPVRATDGLFPDPCERLSVAVREMARNPPSYSAAELNAFRRCVSVARGFRGEVARHMDAQRFASNPAPYTFAKTPATRHLFDELNQDGYTVVPISNWILPSWLFPERYEVHLPGVV